MQLLIVAPHASAGVWDASASNGSQNQSIDESTPVRHLFGDGGIPITGIDEYIDGR